MPIRRLPRRPLSGTVLLLTVACASTQGPPPDADPTLSRAEALIASGALQQAQEVLDQLPDEACPKRLRDRRDLAVAGIRFGQGEAWEAFEVLEQFPDLHPHSELRPSVVEMLWEIGNTLSSSGRGFLFFWSDRRAAQTVLEHLITRHPDTPRLADALRLLGDMAYEDGNYELAQERFRDLMRRRPESEWVKYARFRFAMSIVDSLQGADYDLAKMDHAVRELRDFLAETPENPSLVQTAQAALKKLREWQAQRHVQIAAFYRRVGNTPGQIYHLEIATGKEFEATAAQARAREERAELERTLTNRDAAPAPR